MRENCTYGLMRGKKKTRSENVALSLYRLTSSFLLYCILCEKLLHTESTESTTELLGAGGESTEGISASFNLSSVIGRCVKDT